MSSLQHLHSQSSTTEFILVFSISILFSGSEESAYLWYLFVTNLSLPLSPLPHMDASSSHSVSISSCWTIPFHECLSYPAQIGPLPCVMPLTPLGLILHAQELLEASCLVRAPLWGRETSAGCCPRQRRLWRCRFFQQLQCTKSVVGDRADSQAVWGRAESMQTCGNWRETSEVAMPHFGMRWRKKHLRLWISLIVDL